MNTGDILTSTAANNPLLVHKGILIVDETDIYIAHNTPMHRNNFGGNVVVDRLDDFIADKREIISIEPTGIDYEKIVATIEETAHRKFTSLDWNCEHFVYRAAGNERSPQLQKWTALAALGLLAVL